MNKLLAKGCVYFKGFGMYSQLSLDFVQVKISTGNV